MDLFAKSMALSIKSPRSKHSYYRQIRLLMEHSKCDPAKLREPDIREYFLFLILEKKWAPGTLRMAIAAMKRFYTAVLKIKPWDVFAEINTKDNKKKPDCPTRTEIINLLNAFPENRYLTPTKLIYCCGLRLSECISLTIHDIKREDNVLFIHNSKGERDRVVPIADPMIAELAKYWSYHKNPLLIFPATGVGCQKSESVARRMHTATTPLGRTTFEGKVKQMANKINLRNGTFRNLRHSFGTHFCQRGGNLLKLQRIMGHERIETTMIYLHLTHEIEAASLDLIEDIYDGLNQPRV